MIIKTGPTKTMQMYPKSSPSGGVYVCPVCVMTERNSGVWPVTEFLFKDIINISNTK